MSFEKNYLILPLMFIAVALLLFSLRSLRERTKILDDVWRLKLSNTYKLSEWLKYIAFSLMILTLVDIRTEPKKISVDRVRQKTVILIDNSASMLVEDVRPNRIEKAVMLAKHFVKTSKGEEIAVSLFSDTQKKFIPFTADYDLIISRMNSVERDLRRAGGTNLTIAIQDVLSLFRDKGGYTRGNILVLTDAEETMEEVKLEVPDNINIAIVGVGTTKGGKIPIRGKNGQLYRYKKFAGKDVISKLDVDFLTRLSEQLKNYQYWIAGSYSLPTDEIRAFFKTSLQKQEGKSTIYQKDVLTGKVLVVILCILLLSYILKARKPFVLILIFMLSMQVNADDVNEMIDTNNFGAIAKRKFMNSLIESKNPKSMELLFSENENNETFIDSTSRLNYASSKLANGKIGSGIESMSEIYESLSDHEKEIARSNILNSLKKDQEKSDNKEQEENEEKKEKENQQKQDQDKQNENKDKEKGESDQSEENNDQKDDGDSQKGQEQSDEQSDDKGDKSDQADKNDKSNEKDNAEQNKEEENQDQKDGQQQSESERGDQGEKRQVPSAGNTAQKGDEQVKERVPKVLKQIIDSDNELQKKLFDTSTQGGRDSGRKDW